MVIIIITVAIQSILTPAEDRGSFDGPLLTINSGIFQAIGVISFGMSIVYLLLSGPVTAANNPSQPLSVITTPFSSTGP